MRRVSLIAVLTSILVFALTPALTSATSTLPLGRYVGETSDGHVFQFSVERTKNATYPRKITHFYMVYDIAGCRSGPIQW